MKQSRPGGAALPEAIVRDDDTYEARHTGQLVGLIMKAQGEGWKAYDGAGARQVSPVTFMSPNDALKAYRSVELAPFQTGTDDDVTASGVQKVRDRAAAKLAGADLEHVDGFRLSGNVSSV